MADPEVLPLEHGPQRTSHRLVGMPPPQPSDPVDHPHGHVHRVIAIQPRSLAMPFAGPRTARLAPGPLALAAPPLEVEALLLHLDCADIHPEHAIDKYRSPCAAPDHERNDLTIEKAPRLVSISAWDRIRLVLGLALCACSGGGPGLEAEDRV